MERIYEVHFQGLKLHQIQLACLDKLYLDVVGQREAMRIYFQEKVRLNPMVPVGDQGNQSRPRTNAVEAAFVDVN